LGIFSTALFQQAMINFRAEVINDPSVEKVHPSRQLVTDSRDFVEKYSVNSTDAIILRCALDKVIELRIFGHDLVLICADARLLKAAQGEGLFTFNPETDSQITLNGFIAPSSDSSQPPLNAKPVGRDTVPANKAAHSDCLRSARPARGRANGRPYGGVGHRNNPVNPVNPVKKLSDKFA